MADSDPCEMDIKEEPTDDKNDSMDSSNVEVKIEPSATEFGNQFDGDTEDDEEKPSMDEDGAMLSCQYCGFTSSSMEEMNAHTVEHLGEQADDSEQIEGMVNVDDLLKGYGMKDENYVADLVMEKRDLNTLVMTEKIKKQIPHVKIALKLGIVFYTNLPPDGANKDPKPKSEEGTHYFCLTCGYVSADHAEVHEHSEEAHEEENVPCFICCEKNDGGAFTSSVHEFFGKYSSMNVKGEKNIPNYVCQVCGMRHFYSAYVRRHILAEHGQHLNKPYRCTPCGFGCFEYPHLIYHIKSKHPNRDYGTKVDQAHMKRMKDFLLSKFKIVQVSADEMEKVCGNICVFSAMESVTCACEELNPDADKEPVGSHDPVKSTAITATQDEDNSEASEPEGIEDDNDDDDWGPSPSKRGRGGRGRGVGRGGIAIRGGASRGSINAGKGGMIGSRGGVTASRGNVTAGRGGITVTASRGNVTAGRGGVTTSRGSVTIGRGNVTTNRGGVKIRGGSTRAGSPSSTLPMIQPVILRAARGNHKQTLSRIAQASRQDALQFYFCSACGFISKFERNVEQHIKLQHDGCLFTCNVCDGEFLKKETGKMGDQKHDYTEAKGTLDVSVYKVTGKMPLYICSTCEYCHIIRGFIQRHINTVHTEQNKLPFQCQLCEYGCLDVKILKHHHAVYHGDTPITGFKKVNFKLPGGPITKFTPIQQVEDMIRLRQIKPWNHNLVNATSNIDIKPEPK